MSRLILFVVGPTGSGKTEISIRLAKKLKGEIVSADSMLVYRGLNIGTAKPTRTDQNGVRHHLMDLVGPRSRFSVEKYRKLALKKINEIISRKKIPIVAGGSGLYIQALIDGLASQESNSATIRKRLEDDATQKGLDVLYKKLVTIDPRRANQILPSDARRIVRALEIYEVTGELPSVWRENKVSLRDLGFEWVLIGLKRDRAELYERLNRRVDEMIEKGFLGEVKLVMKKGMSLTSKQAIGYKELIDYLKGRSSFADAVLMIKQRSRNLAKKQLTWFRKESRICWVDVRGADYSNVVKQILNLVKNHA